MSLYYIIFCSAFQIFVGQKMHESQRRANCFKVFLNTIILHQIIATQNAYLVKDVLSIPWVCWKWIMGRVFCTAGLWTRNSNCLLKPYLNVWRVTYFTMPEFINGFSSETACFYHCLIDKFLLTSFLLSYKVSGNLRSAHAVHFYDHTSLLNASIKRIILSY